MATGCERSSGISDRYPWGSNISVTLPWISRVTSRPSSDLVNKGKDLRDEIVGLPREG